MKHWIKISILSILTVLVAVIVYFSFYMLSFSLDADNDRVAKINTQSLRACHQRESGIEAMDRQSEPMPGTARYIHHHEEW